MPFTTAQQMALAVAPKVTAPLSVLGSFLILKSILSDRTKMSSSYHRILCAMSTVDLIASFWYFASTWPIPEGTLGVWSPSGNSTICQVQGFFIQTSTWIPALNASLAIYYLLASRYRWTEERIRKLEPLLIGGPVLMGLGTAIVSIPLKLYNNANLWCWIAPFPLNCKDSFRYGEEANCIRGDNAWIYRWAFAYAPVWLNIVIATFCMIMVYWTVLTQEKSVDKFQSDGLTLRKQSARIAWQGLWYVTAFYATWTPATLVRLLQTIPSTKNEIYYPLVLLMAICLPLQGFLNFIVFSRARYLMFRREQPAATRWKALQVAAFSTIPRHHSEEGDQEEDSTNQTDCPVATEAILQSEVVPKHGRA